METEFIFSFNGGNLEDTVRLDDPSMEKCEHGNYPPDPKNPDARGTCEHGCFGPMK